MKIENLFTKDLSRQINGVVKVDQQDEAVVWQELDEYVVTRELDTHLRRFVAEYLGAKDNRHDPVIAGRIGVWVSGFFGSGKSHFIKILSYLLRDIPAHDPQSGEACRASEFFDKKIKDPLFLADIKRAVDGNTDVVSFNIDSKADNKQGRDAILQVFMRVFNEMQGFSPDHPHIAELERRLTNENVLDRFHSAFKAAAAGREWLVERDSYEFFPDEIVQALTKTRNMSLHAANEWFEKSKDNYSLTIEKFAKLVNDYLEQKGKQARIVFIVDEVGQFIGNDTHLMLNLQTITEDLGGICKGRAWVIVTSQEDIDAVIGEVKASKANDFSKIQGRFVTRLSLSSSNTDEVIQVRLLEKTPAARIELTDLFERKGEILKNQLSFSNLGTTLKTYRDVDDFVNSYPFVPYHFHLVQQIFESIRKVGATGLHLARGERSMLDAFQTAACNIAEREVGALVPLYEFYGAIESFLDTAVKLTIDNAGSNPSLQPFDGKLLRLLFLIRYVETMKASVDNLVTLCIDETDADRLKLKKQIEESLARLERETLVNRNGDFYSFLTNEERDVSREIKTIDVTSGEESKRLAEFIFDEVLKGVEKHRYAVNKRDYAFNRVCDGVPVGTRADAQLNLEVITPLNDDYLMFNPARGIVYSTERDGQVVVKLGDSKELEGELRTLLQTEKFVRHKADAAAPPSLRKILSERTKENGERRKRLIGLLDRLIQESDIYALGQSLPPSPNINSRTRVGEAQSYLIKNAYTKLALLEAGHENLQAEIKATLLMDDIGQQSLNITINETNPLALAEVRQFIDLKSAMNARIALDELVERFTGRPYGWTEWGTVLLVARLFVAGEIGVLYEGASLEPRESVEAFTQSRRHKAIMILKRRTVGVTDLNAARALGQRLFSRIGADSEDALREDLRGELDKWKIDLVEFKTLADTGNYPGKEEIDTASTLINQLLHVRDGYTFFEEFNARRGELEETGDDLNDLRDFYRNQRATWERLQAAMRGSIKDNRQIIEHADEEAKRVLARMDEISRAAQPYRLLHETDDLIRTVNGINENLINQKRERGIEFVDGKIAEIKVGLEAIKADSDFSNLCLKPLQDIKKRLENLASIPAIYYESQNVTREAERAAEAIEERRNPKPAGVANVKATKYLSLAHVNTKYYLESETDVDEFLARLRREIVNALNENARVRIQ